MASNKNVTILGLGSMGLKLAALLVNAGYHVNVWNRTIAKANSLSGVSVQDDINKAVSISSILIICVYDYEAAKNILDSLQDKKTLAGKIIINFTTGSPHEADALEAWLNTNEADYLNGALQVAPDQMGRADTTILISGSETVYQSVETLLQIFGGNLKYLGTKALLASAMDLATLSWLYGSYVGMLHGVALCQKSGLDLEFYKDILGEITPGFTEFFKQQVGVIANEDFQVSQSPLSISVSATRRIYNAAEDYNLNTEFFSVISNYLKRADDRGLGGKELASLIEIIRDESSN